MKSVRRDVYKRQDFQMFFDLQRNIVSRICGRFAVFISIDAEEGKISGMAGPHPVVCGLLLAGALQGVMVSLNGQLGNYYSPFAICFFVHGIALILLLAYLLAKKTPLGFKGAPW